MPGHRQPLASPDGEVFSLRCRKDVLCSWHTVLYARPLFRKKRREYIYIYIIIQIFLNFFQKNVSKRRTLSELNWSLMCPKRPQRHFVNFFVRANQPMCLAFGTGEGHLWYGICVPCSKRLPGVRDAFSEAFGVKNRLLRYGRDIRCQKQPSLVRDASSKAHRTAPATSNASPKARRTAPAAPNAYSEACRAKSSLLPTGRIFSARNGPRSDVSRHKKR